MMMDLEQEAQELIRQLSEEKLKDFIEKFRPLCAQVSITEAKQVVMRTGERNGGKTGGN